MCTICQTHSTDTKKRLNEIATALKAQNISKKHADDLIARALGMELPERDRDAEAAWEDGRER